METVNVNKHNAHRLSRRGLLLAAPVLAALVLAMNLGNVNAADEPPVVEHMTVVNDGYKMLRRQARTKDFNEESLKHVIEMQKAALAAMHEEPPILAKIPAGEKAKFMIEYKKGTRLLIDALLDMEIALLEGNKDQVVELIDKLGSIKKEGHDKFVEE